MSVFIESNSGLFIAFGIVLGSHGGRRGRRTVLAAPTQTMLEVADRIKIWALAAAIGGTIDPMRVIESNVAVGNLSPAIKQVLYLGFAFRGTYGQRAGQMGVLQPELIDARTSSPPLPPLLSGRIHLRAGDGCRQHRLQLGLSCSLQ